MSALDLEEIIHIIYTFLTPTCKNVLSFSAVNSTFRNVVKSSKQVKTEFSFVIVPPKSVDQGKREDFKSDKEYKLHCYQKMNEPFEFRKEVENCGELLQLFTDYYFEHCKLSIEQYKELFESKILKVVTFKMSDFIPANIVANSSLKYLTLSGSSFIVKSDFIILRERLTNLEGLQVDFYHNEILNMTQLKHLHIKCITVDNKIVNQILQTPFENLEKLEINSYHFNEIEKFHLPKLKELNLIHNSWSHSQHIMDETSVRNILSSIKDNVETLTLLFRLDDRIFYEINNTFKLKRLIIEKPSDEFKEKFSKFNNVEFTIWQ